jgi:hypothetical protein
VDGISGKAENTAVAAQSRYCADAVSNREAVDAGADRLDRAGELVPED